MFWILAIGLFSDLLINWMDSNDLERYGYGQHLRVLKSSNVLTLKKKVEANRGKLKATKVFFALFFVSTLVCVLLLVLLNATSINSAYTTSGNLFAAINMIFSVVLFGLAWSVTDDCGPSLDQEVRKYFSGEGHIQTAPRSTLYDTRGDSPPRRRRPPQDGDAEAPPPRRRPPQDDETEHPPPPRRQAPEPPRNNYVPEVGPPVEKGFRYIGGQWTQDPHVIFNVPREEDREDPENETMEEIAQDIE